MKYKLRPSVSVVDLHNGVIEFFKTSTRISLKIHPNSKKIKDFVLSCNGEIESSELCAKLEIDEKSENFKNLILYLKKNSILTNDSLIKDRVEYNKFRRVIHFLEDYATTDDDLLFMWEKIRNGRIVIVGMGAVGTWVAENLVQSGVRNLVLLDNDVVEISNLHRQFGFDEDDIGIKKTSAIKKHLLEMSDDLNIEEYNMFLTERSLAKISGDINLIINCADKPTVDETSLIVGKFCMSRRIPHIIGGGYNLHLSLIGQTVIPYKTACVKCYEKQLITINNIEDKKIEKLSIKNRKIGSFGPMCSLIASLIGMEAIKILSCKIPPSNINRRGEFNIYDMKIKYMNFDKLADCEWCGGINE